MAVNSIVTEQDNCYVADKLREAGSTLGFRLPESPLQYYPIAYKAVLANKHMGATKRIAEMVYRPRPR